MVYANLESTLENETHKVLRDFDLQPDHLISASRPDQLIVNKKKKKRKKKKDSLPNSGLSQPGRPQSKNKGKRKER